jgi:hypothetical protein
VDADVEHRAWYLAHLVAPILAPGSLARDVLVRYGNRDDVKRSLMSSFGTEGWIGPASDHLRQKQIGLQSVLEGEHEPKVRAWITAYVALLDKEIEDAKVGEEREF